MIRALLLVLLLATTANAQLAPGTYDPSVLFPSGTQIVVPTPTYTLAITHQGTGVGTVLQSPSNPIPSGILVTLTPSPTGGSIFLGFGGPSPCPQGTTSPATFTMPANNLTCTVAWDPALPPPQGTPGTWDRLSSHLAVGDVPPFHGFTYGVLDTKRGRFYYMPPPDTGRMTEYDIATNTWSSTVDTVTNLGPAAHNCSMVYDPVNDLVWFASCGPQPVAGSFYWSPVTKKFTKWSDLWLGGCTLDTFLWYMSDRSFGCLSGWGGFPLEFKVGRQSLDPLPTTPNMVAMLTAAPPAGPNTLAPEDVRYGPVRAGLWNGLPFYVDAAADLWVLHADFSQWTKYTTSGAKPPLPTAYAFDTATNRLIGYASLDNSTATPIYKTYELNLATFQWTLGPDGPHLGGYWGINTFPTLDGHTAWILWNNGEYRTEVWKYTPVATPPDSYDVSVATTGPGSVLMSPANPVALDADVTLTAQPVNATFNGFSGPAPCPQGTTNPATFKMPSRNVACTATFTPTTPPPIEPPPGDYVPTPMPSPMPVQVFVPVPAKPVYDGSPWPYQSGSKHQRWAADGKGNVWTGFGDTTPTRHGGNTAQNQGFVYTPATDVWRRWNAACRPSGLQPSYPDEVPWGYDNRGALWLFPGVLQGSDDVRCDSGTGEAGSTLYKTGLFRYGIAEDEWTRFTDGQALPGTNALWGGFDNVTKSLMWWSDGGCGAQFTMLNVDTRQRTIRDLCPTVNPYPGNPYGTFELPPDGRLTHWAFDEVNRLVYIVANHAIFENGTPTGNFRIRFWSYNVDTGTVTLLPDPPNVNIPGRYSDADAGLIAWDSTNSVLLYPWSRTHCGELEGMYVYVPSTQKWESYPLTLSSPVPNKNVPRGNSAVYEPVSNVLVLGGTYSCADWGYPGHGSITHHYLWRYK